MKLWRNYGRAFTEALTGQMAADERPPMAEELWTPRALAAVVSTLCANRDVDYGHVSSFDEIVLFDDAAHDAEVAYTALEIAYLLARRCAHTDDEWDALMGDLIDSLSQRHDKWSSAR